MSRGLGDVYKRQLSNNPNESYTRFPDLTGDFEQHATAFAGVLFSPGTRIDGSTF